MANPSGEKKHRIFNGSKLMINFQKMQFYFSILDFRGVKTDAELSDNAIYFLFLIVRFEPDPDPTPRSLVMQL